MSKLWNWIKMRLKKSKVKQIYDDPVPRRDPSSDQPIEANTGHTLESWRRSLENKASAHNRDMNAEQIKNK